MEIFEDFNDFREDLKISLRFQDFGKDFKISGKILKFGGKFQDFGKDFKNLKIFRKKQQNLRKTLHCHEQCLGLETLENQ